MTKSSEYWKVEQEKEEGEVKIGDSLTVRTCLFWDRYVSIVVVRTYTYHRQVELSKESFQNMDPETLSPPSTTILTDRMYVNQHITLGYLAIRI